MKFVQLSQDLQVAAGETVLLRCVTAAHVHRCRWLWRPFDSPNAAQQPDPVEVKNFAAFGEDSRDCSVRFSSVLPEQAGEWTCGVKPDSEGAFQDAPPARLTLLPAVKIRFVDLPENRRVASGSTISLPCSVTSGVSLCRWILTPVNVIDVPQYPVEFAGQGNWSRDCTLTLKDVQPAHEGLWTCSVLGPPSTDTLYSAPPIKLEVYQPVTVEFTELTQAIQMPTGSPVLLRCVTTQHVQQCRWIKSSNDEYSEGIQEELNTLKEFEPFGDENNDCSMRFSAVSPEQSGEWTCSVQPVGETEFQAAPASRLTVLPPGSASVV
ncbi:hypothetical protein B566_EDAN016031 [Ephemera danica]|nr:hypothetical protein B566_EDAN016031 [Ephemera danica]